MRIIKKSKGNYLIQMTMKQAAKMTEMYNLYPNILPHLFNGVEELLCTTGAKLYPRGGGWFLLSGYACDESDTVSLLK